MRACNLLNIICTIPSGFFKLKDPLNNSAFGAIPTTLNLRNTIVYKIDELIPALPIQTNLLNAPTS